MQSAKLHVKKDGFLRPFLLLINLFNDNIHILGKIQISFIINRSYGVNVVINARIQQTHNIIAKSLLINLLPLKF